MDTAENALAPEALWERLLNSFVIFASLQLSRFITNGRGTITDGGTALFQGTRPQSGSQNGSPMITKVINPATHGIPGLNGTNEIAFPFSIPSNSYTYPGNVQNILIIRSSPFWRLVCVCVHLVPKGFVVAISLTRIRDSFNVIQGVMSVWPVCGKSLVVSQTLMSSHLGGTTDDETSRCPLPFANAFENFHPPRFLMSCSTLLLSFTYFPANVHPCNASTGDRIFRKRMFTKCKYWGQRSSGKAFLNTSTGDRDLQERYSWLMMMIIIFRQMQVLGTEVFRKSITHFSALHSFFRITQFFPHGDMRCFLQMQVLGTVVFRKSITQTST